MRAALVAAPCARIAIAALTALGALPAFAGAADPRACADDARCGVVTVPLVASDPAAGTLPVGYELYAHRRGAKARDTILVSAGSDGAATTGDRAELLALLNPLRRRRDIVLVDARGSGRSGRVGTRSDAYGAVAAAADLEAVRSALGIHHVELYGAGDGAAIALAYAERHADRLRALVLDGGPRATLLSGDGRAEAHALAKALGPGLVLVARLAARLRTHPLHAGGRLDDDALARLAASGDPVVMAELPGAAAAALHGDAVPLARLAASAATPTARAAAKARASSCLDAAPPAPSAQVAGGPFTGTAWKRALGLAACTGFPRPAAPDPVVPAGATPPLVSALVLGGELDVRTPTTALRRVAALLPKGTFVRVRGAGSWPALAAPDGCAGAIARDFLRSRGHLAAGCASRAVRPQGVTQFPATVAAAPAASRDARAHGRDRSDLSDRRAATVAALGVADALQSAEQPGAAATVAGLRGGSATVTRTVSGVTLAVHGLRFVRDGALDGVVTHDAATGSVYAALALRATDGSTRAFVLSWSTSQVRGYAAARGSRDGRPLLLVLRAP